MTRSTLNCLPLKERSSESDEIPARGGTERPTIALAGWLVTEYKSILFLFLFLAGQRPPHAWGEACRYSRGRGPGVQMARCEGVGIPTDRDHTDGHPENRTAQHSTAPHHTGHCTLIFQHPPSRHPTLQRSSVDGLTSAGGVPSRRSIQPPSLLLPFLSLPGSHPSLPPSPPPPPTTTTTTTTTTSSIIIAVSMPGLREQNQYITELNTWPFRMPFQHPRRTTKTTSSPVTPTPANASTRPTIITNMSLRKGATFHSPTSPVEQEFKVPSLPRRSQTTLEDVVDAHKRRVALTLGDIDRGLSAVEERSPSSRQSFRDEAEPVPRGLINSQGSSPATASYGAIMDGVMSKEAASIGRHSLRPRHNRRPSKYSSDSGLGSSIGSRSGKQDVDTSPTTVTDERKSGTASAITRSAAAHTSAINRLPRLSVRASNRINEHILKPLLAKSSLKDFQPIVKDCPRRVHCKEIVCLRDLEKTLIFMAPVSDSDADVDGGVAHWFSRLKERTKTAALYLDFCLTSIRCIQATVEFLSERELTRPHDRPYTNGYFVDLVDQIKQYAQQVKAAKEKEAKGEKLDEMDPES
ncbi:hypothetical protein B7494_g6519 [Chlorociboria aeruginascens]|nr:hypothetical protein B7494_g6519 [Chlorociboria aeruginascens]